MGKAAGLAGGTLFPAAAPLFLTSWGLWWGRLQPGLSWAVGDLAGLALGVLAMTQGSLGGSVFGATACGSPASATGLLGLGCRESHHNGYLVDL